MRLLIPILTCFIVTNLVAQNPVTVEGTVTGEFGKPLSGVIINSKDGKHGTFTDATGTYQITIEDTTGKLVFSSIGYSTQESDIANKKTIDISLIKDAHRNDEIVELGYTTQLRREVSGAVSTVRGEELERSPVANFTQTLPGRLAGLTTQETFSELSRANTNLYIRGLASARNNGPLVVIDGIICAYNSNQTLEYISPSEIESVSILKDASTQALYGIQGANGLIVVKTKRGTKGELQIKTRFDQAIQQVTTRPIFYNSAEYATLRNQAAFNDGLGENYFFTPAEIENYRSGTNRELYPNNNWYDRFIKPSASMQRASVNLTGGNEKVQFFSNVNFMHQGGQFRTEQTEYNPNANNVWVNYRSNVDMTINKYLKAFVRLSGNVKRERTPGFGNAIIFSSIPQIPSNVYGPVTPEIIDKPSGETMVRQGEVITTERVANPTYGMLNRTGYIRHTVTNITSQFGLDLDMGFLTKGLNLSGVFAYQTNSVGSLATRQDYERWMRTDNPDTLAFIKKGGELNTPLAYSKSHSYYYHLTYNTALNYKRDFGRHSIGGMAYMFYQNLTKADVSSPGLLPYNRISSGVEATYGYNNRYFAKFDLGYSGSEQYARGSRYITTPAVSVAWLASEESFLKNSQWLSNLKLRASYGKAGNDQSGLARYAYLDNVTVNGGGPLGYLQYVINENQKGNPNIRAEVSTATNVGIDLGLFNSLSVSVDVFRDRMENMVVDAASTIPAYQGIPLDNYPSTNSGIFENKGYEITLNYSRALNQDLNFYVGGMLSYAKNKLIKVNEAVRSDDYAFTKWQEGYSFGQQFGYLVDYSNGNGFFNTQDELQNSGLAYGFGTPRVGDLKYQDLNGDGKIDERDKAPVGSGLLPRIIYSMSGGVQYKSFELNMLFQGVADYSTIMEGTGIWETDFDGVFGSLHGNAWTPERYANGSTISWPALSLTKTVNHEPSDFVEYNRAYLRLKNIELAYTLPLSFRRAISSENIRFVLSGQNLFTWHKMKSDDFGPEGDGYSAIPVYRVYNVGFSITF
jgi:TonB-linked SusC/RagA family outer membrane protein